MDPQEQFLPLLDDNDSQIGLRQQVQKLGSQLRILNNEQQRQGKVLDSQRKQLSKLESLLRNCSNSLRTLNGSLLRAEKQST
jgi:cell division protein FtsL